MTDTLDRADSPERLNLALRPTRPPLSVGARQRPSESTQVEIVIPVYNEEADLADSVHRLYDDLTERFPVPWLVTIVDNASTDADVGRRLSTGVGARWRQRHPPGPEGPRPGSPPGLDDQHRSRGRLHGCRPVDRSQRSAAPRRPPAQRPQRHRHRHSPGTRRAGRPGPPPRVHLPLYNLLLRAALRIGFSDAQCGFKAMRTDVARDLLPLVADEEWFFDTELLVLGERNGLRVHEVPVDWVDDPGSTVHVTHTAYGRPPGHGSPHDRHGAGRVTTTGTVRHGRERRRHVRIGPARTTGSTRSLRLHRSGQHGPVRRPVHAAATCVGIVRCRRRGTVGVLRGEHRGEPTPDVRPAGTYRQDPPLQRRPGAGGVPAGRQPGHPGDHGTARADLDDLVGGCVDRRERRGWPRSFPRTPSMGVPTRTDRAADPTKNEPSISKPDLVGRVCRVTFGS